MNPEMTTARTAKRAAAMPAAQAALAPISVHEVYPLKVFKQRSGLDSWALRKAKRAGLRVFAVGRRRYVRGSDFAEFLGQLPEESDS
jgi:hypothetical protein